MMFFFKQIGKPEWRVQFFDPFKSLTNATILI